MAYSRKKERFVKAASSLVNHQPKQSTLRAGLVILTLSMFGCQSNHSVRPSAENFCDSFGLRWAAWSAI
jgi:hypothetical protein